MHASVRSLLTRIIDYAGTFPPANLPLDQALRDFSQYREDPAAWILGRFVCPASQLRDIVPLVQEATLPDRSLSFAILGRGGKDVPEFFRNVETDLADVQAFAGACPGLVQLETYEVRLPAPLFDPIKANQIGAAISTMAFLIEKSGQALFPFVEVPSPHKENLQAALTALHEDQHSAEAAQRRLVPRCGLKLRTGGLEPAAFPPPQLVAAVLAGCRQTYTPFKATAGLHHPLRRHDPAIGTRMHGFLNLFLAACLTHAFDLPVDVLEKILQEEDPASFQFEDDAISWNSHRVTHAQIEKARAELATSFGCCSFTEPRDDLTTLGLL